jgi:hypothetical protein
MSITTARLFEAPSSEPAQRLEALRQRGVKIRAEHRQASLAADAAARELEAATIAQRSGQDRALALGEKHNAKEAAAVTAKARRAADAAAAKADALRRASAVVDSAMLNVAQNHMPELVEEIAQQHAAAMEEVHKALDQLRAAHAAIRESYKAMMNLTTGHPLGAKVVEPPRRLRTSSEPAVSSRSWPLAIPPPPDDQGSPLPAAAAWLVAAGDRTGQGRG